MAEKIVSDISDLALEDELNDELANGKDFLEALKNKVRQLGGEILNVEFKVDNKLLFFSIETKKINDESFARELIKLIDNLTYEFFFKNLKIYLNQIGVQNICFFLVTFHLVKFNLCSLLGSKTFLDIKRHPCFICESYHMKSQE